MAFRRLQVCALFVASIFIVSDANAFWWIFRAAAGRSAVATGARVGAAATAAEAEGAIAAGSRALGTGARAGVAGAAEAEGTAAAGSRFCVRPPGASTCDFRRGNSSYDAVARAVGPGYRIQPSGRPTIFEILDAAGNVVSIVQAISPEADPSVASLPQYQPAIAVPVTYSQSEPLSVAPLRHNGEVLNLHVNAMPTHVWSEGYVEVWADNHPMRVVLAPGQKLHFPGNWTVHAIPKSADAYTLFSQPSGAPRVQQAAPTPNPPAIFPWGSNVPCPQIMIGNGMARCQ